MTATPMTIDVPLLVVIAGPTAVGKTSIGIQLASHFSSEIISADSRQFFREMKIGTAAPGDAELEAVPHHFVRHLSVHDAYNVSRYESDVLALLEKLFVSYPVVFMVGGSGLYIDAVCHGIDLLPDPDAGTRKELKELLATSGIGALREELMRADPVYAAVVDASNPARLIRALEVCRTTGVPYSSFRTNQPKKRPFRILKLGFGLQREVLNARINARVDAMMENGLYGEALALYPLKHLNSLNTVGYRELFDHFEGQTSLEFAVEKIKTNTRRYAKRQLTWFGKDPQVHWSGPGEIRACIDLINTASAEGDIRSIPPQGRTRPW